MSIRTGEGFRPEIQGLRAVAVVLVVLFHLWPKRLSGGYVGVDVFFVLSGYLITSHLLREVLETGRLRLAQFWGRRIRRLLPASLLVLALATAGVLLVAPSTTWHDTARQVAASALYVQNWALSADAVDYLARDNAPTVAQHYWSLSVEEQFYAVWPLLVLLVLWLRGRGRHAAASTRTALFLGLLAVFAVSLGWSVLATAQDQAAAYFSTFTRAWEFAAGALAATVVVRRTSRWSPLVGWAGLAAVVAAAVVYSGASAFPGWIALLPVGGTVALLLTGVRGPGTAGWWLSLRPARWVGDVSYSVYLVHWPLIVLVPAYLGRDLVWRDKLAVIAATLVLAWLSKTYVEDPLRTGPVLTGGRARPFVFAATGMASLVLANLGVQTLLAHRESVAVARTVVALTTTASPSPTSCLGPAALLAPVRCHGVAGRGDLLVPADVVAAESTTPMLRRCQVNLDEEGLRTCHVGDTTHPRLHVALVGDSHATHWIPLLDTLGREHGWDVRVLVKGSCPSTDARRVLPNESGHGRQESCERFNDAVDHVLLSDPSITDVFASSFASSYQWTNRPGRHLADPAIDGFAQRWARWVAAGKRVHVIADVPGTAGRRVPACLEQHQDHPQACSVPRRDALAGDTARAAVRGLRGVSLVDLTAEFCDASRCYARIGDVVVYRDKSHISVEYARLLAPYLARQLTAPLV